MTLQGRIQEGICVSLTAAAIGIGGAAAYFALEDVSTWRGNAAKSDMAQEMGYARQSHQMDVAAQRAGGRALAETMVVVVSAGVGFVTWRGLRRIHKYEDRLAASAAIEWHSVAAHSVHGNHKASVQSLVVQQRIASRQ